MGVSPIPSEKGSLMLLSTIASANVNCVVSGRALAWGTTLPPSAVTSSRVASAAPGPPYAPVSNAIHVTMRPVRFDSSALSAMPNSWPGWSWMIPRCASASAIPIS